MSDPFVAEIRIFPYNFAPNGWAQCDGQLMPISQNTALFSLLGTTYGGNGQSTFALPDMRGAFPMQPGQGPGLSERLLGEFVGAEVVTLDASQMPAHTHTLVGGNSSAQVAPGSGTVGASPGKAYHPGPATGIAPSMLSDAGSGIPHNNLPPYLVFTFCIALQGIFPPRS